MFFQRLIVRTNGIRHTFLLRGKIVKLVDCRDVDPGGTGQTVIAIHTLAANGRFCTRAQASIVFLLRRGIFKGQIPLHFLNGFCPKQHRRHRRTIQRILDALRGRERHAKGRGFGIEQAACSQRFHNSNADAFFLTQSIERRALRIDGKAGFGIIGFILEIIVNIGLGGQQVKGRID